MMARVDQLVGGWARRRWRWLLLATVLILLSAAALWGVPTILAVEHRQDRAQRQVDGLSRSNDALRKQVQQLGQQPVAPPASKVRQNPDQPIPSPSPTAVGPTLEQVEAGVAAYCSQPSQPCRAPGTAPAQVYAAVANFLKQHPPAAGPAGPGPTADQMYAAIVRYCEQDSAPCRGPAGEQGSTGPTGPTGPGPTDEQLADAVRAYMQANPPPVCPDATSATAETVLTASGPVDAVICVRS